MTFNRARFPNVTPEQQKAIEELANAEFQRDMYERYNPKYLEVAEERVKKANAELERLIREAVEKSKK